MNMEGALHMPTYRSNSQDCMRRPNTGCGCSAKPPVMPYPAYTNGQNSCSCPGSHDELAGMPLAMAYVPWQPWRCPYEAEKGLHRGTIFEDLDKPFRGMGGCNR